MRFFPALHLGGCMATLNKLARVYNNEGTKARTIDLVSQLERSVMSCMLWENEFYDSGVSITQRIAELIPKIPADEVARIAIQAKQDMRLRHIPLFMARELMRTKAGRAEAATLFPAIIKRPDDATEFLAIYWKDNKEEPLANQVKLHLGNAMRKFDEYQLAKYNGGAKAVKLRDVLRITRPKPEGDTQGELWGKVISGTLTTPDTWEVAISSSKDKKVTWTRLLKEDKLGGLAMLRNIRNMAQAGVENDLIRDGIVAINAGKLLPINFITAARHNPQFETYIEKKFFECFANKEKREGKTIVLVDISPSMNCPLSSRSELTRTDVACSLAMIARELYEDVRIFSFATKRVEVPARHGFGLRDAILRSQQSNGTLLGHALKDLPPHDRLIVITDEESQDPVPDMKGYMINVASTKNGVGYGTWTHIDGWSDKVLDYIQAYETSL